jgi:hypothetical protein
MDGPWRRTLENALETVGGSEERLAAALRLSQLELQKYLSGDTPLPHKVFLEALDIVARGPHAR